MFVDPQSYDFVRTLSSHWKAIREESRSLATGAFQPWVQEQMYGEGWSVFGLYVYGRPIAPSCALCPRTAEILSQIPGLLSAGFSRLAPHTHVKAHVGWDDSFYRLHLGLDVPLGCRLRVEHETRHWREGECLIFDDTQEHEAWNDADAQRIVLLLDFLKPGVSAPKPQNMPEEVKGFAKNLLDTK